MPEKTDFPGTDSSGIMCILLPRRIFMKAKRRIPSAILSVLLTVVMLIVALPIAASAKYTYEYYAADGTNYIYQTCLYFSSSNNESATSWLSSNGWTPVGGNFNAGDGNDSKYIHLGVKYTTDPSKAVRGFQVRDSSDRPNSYQAAGTVTGQTVTWYKVGSGAIDQTPNAGDGVVDLNKGGGGNDLTLYITVDPKAGPPVTAYTQSQSGNAGTAQSNLTNNGWSVAWDQNGNWQDCNEGSGGDYLYQGYKSSATAVDTNALRNAYNNAGNYLSTTTWTSASVAAVKTARSNAKTCFDAFDNKAGVAPYTQSQINSYTSAITTALNNLQIQTYFDAATNGGTLSGVSATMTYTTGTSSSKSQSFSSYKATKSGWTFAGWNKDSTALGGTTGNVTLSNGDKYYATFKKDFSMKYYYLNADGTVATEDRTSTIYNTATGTSFPYKTRSDVTINGKTYKFCGYREDATAAAPTWTANSYSMSVSGTNSKTVYAVYKTDINFTQNSGRGTPAIASESKVQYLASTAAHPMTTVTFTVTSTTPTYAGGAFKGWDTSSDATSVVYTAGNTISTTADVNLYAVYNLYTYTVTFKDEDGTVLKTQTVKYGFDATAPAAPTKASDDTNEYTFDGWSGYTDVKSPLTITASYTAKAHVFAIEHLVIPTCTEYGADKYTCSNCGYTKTLPVDPNGHSFSTEPGYAATCTTAGLTDKVFCTTCGYVESDSTVIPALGHDMVEGTIVPATCKSKGYTPRKCSRCGLEDRINETPLDSSAHNVVEIPAVEATCVNSGKTAGEQCSFCGAVLVAPKTVIAEGHKWIAASCTEAKTCSVCGISVGEALGHNYAVSAAKDATCTEDGYTAGQRCTRCGDIPAGSEVTVIPATGHAYGEATVVPATCTAEGSETKTCSICGNVSVTVIEKIAHTPVAMETVEVSCKVEGSEGGTKCSVCGTIIEEPTITAKLDHTFEKTADTVEPTCQAAGTTAVYTCSVCGFEKGGTTVPKVGHAYGAWTVTTAATCTTAGEKVRTCIYDCGLTDTKVLTAIGHVPVAVKAKAATCTADGNTVGKKCVLCDEITEGCEVIPATGHAYAVASTVAPTCEAQGYNVYRCANCTSSYNDDYVDATGHTEETIAAVESTCTALGKTEGTKCSVCGKVLVKPETVAKKDHTKVEYGAVAPTCTESGMKAGTKCSVCGRIYAEPTVAPAKGHTADLGTISVVATCIQEGEVTYACVDCGTVLSKENTGYGQHKLSDEYVLEGGMVRFTCTVCGTEIKTEPSAVGLPDTGCEKCGIHHRDGSKLFEYNGFYCKLVGFFRSLLAKFKK